MNGPTSTAPESSSITAAAPVVAPTKPVTSTVSLDYWQHLANAILILNC